MNEHTSSDVFATDLLAGNWAFIGGAGYSNVIKDVLYEGDDEVTAVTGSKTYSLVAPFDGYDYSICNIKIVRTTEIVSRAVAILPAGTSAVTWSYSLNGGSEAQIEVFGFVTFLVDNHQSILFAMRSKGSAIKSVILEKVEGFKVNSMTLS